MTNLRRSLITPSYAQGFARCAGEAANPGLWRGLVGAWMPSLGPTGGTLFDVSGHKNDGVLTDMDVGEDWVPEPNGYAIDFDGADDFVNIPDSDSLAILGDMSIAVSLFPRAVGSTTVCMEKGSDTLSNVTYGFGWSGSAGVSFIHANNFVATSSFSLIQDVWQDIVMVRHAATNTVEFFVDGIFVDSVGFSGQPVDNNDILGFGRRGNPADSGFSYNGKMTNLYIYNHALSASEIVHLYQDPLALVRRKGRVIQVRANNNVPQKFMHYSRMRSA